MQLALTLGSGLDLREVESMMATKGWSVMIRSIRAELLYHQWRAGCIKFIDGKLQSATPDQLDSIREVQRLTDFLSVIERFQLPDNQSPLIHKGVVQIP